VRDILFWVAAFEGFRRIRLEPGIRDRASSRFRAISDSGSGSSVARRSGEFTMLARAWFGRSIAEAMKRIDHGC
jgi:hypothetical protein